MSAVAASHWEAGSWPVVRLGEVVEFRRGLTYSKSDEVESSTTAVLRANNVNRDSGALNFTNIRFLSDDVEIPVSKRLVADSLLICTASGSRDHLGKMAYVAEALDYAFGGFMGLLVPKSTVCAKYLWYFSRFDVYRDYLQQLSPGANINNLRFDDLGKLEIPLPPTHEQRRIVAVLDQAFAALDCVHANIEANLESSERLLQGALDRTFDEIALEGPSLPLQEAVHSDCLLSYGIVQPGDEVSDGLPIVRPVDLTQRQVGISRLKRIAPEAARGYARTTLQGGDLLLCVRGSTGIVSVASEQLVGANVTRGIVPIRFDQAKVLPDFAYFQFCSKVIRNQILAKTYGAALMQINIKDLRAVRFLVPDLALQREVVNASEAILESARSLQSLYAKELTDIAALRQSLLQAAFSGQLT